MKKPKTMRFIGWCFIVLAVVFGSAVLFFNMFIAQMQAGIILLLGLAVSAFVIQASLFFIWADLIEQRSRNEENS